MENEIIKRFRTRFASLYLIADKELIDSVNKNIEQFILSELEALKEERLGEYRGCSLCGREINYKGYILNYC